MGFQVGSAEVAVVPVFTGFRREVDREVGGAGQRAGAQFNRGFRKSGDGLAKEAGSAGGRAGSLFAGAMTKAVGALAVIGLADKLTSAVTDGIEKANDLAETGSKVNQVFGSEGAAALDKFSQGAAQKLGQTKLDVLSAASTFGVFGKSAGLSGKGLSDFSSQFVTLSTDLASFHNADPSETVEALGAALRGESEPMRRFGVLLDDASMRQKALKMGLIKTTKQALTPQQKVLAAQALIMEQTKDAQGDFQKTSGGLANQQRILAAQWSEMKTQLGTALLPVVTRVVTFMNQNMRPAFEKVWAVAKEFVGGVRAFREAWKAFDGDITSSGFAGVMEGLAFKVRGFFEAFRSSGATSGLLSGFKAVVAWFKSDLVPAVSGAVSAYIGYVQQGARIIGQFVNGMMTRIRPMMPQIRQVFSTIGQIITSVLGLVQVYIQRVTGVIGALWSRWGETIMNVAGWAFGRLLAIIQPALNIVLNIVKFFTNALKGDWSAAWENIKAIGSSAVQLVKASIETTMQAVQKVVETIMGKVKEAVRTGLDKVGSFFSELPGKVLGFLNQLATDAFNAGAAIMTRLGDGIKSKVTAAVDAIKAGVKAVGEFLPHSPAKRGEFSGSGWGGWGEAVGDRFADGLTARTGTIRAAAKRMSAAGLPQTQRLANAATGSGQGPAITMVNNITQPTDPWVISERLGRAAARQFAAIGKA